MERRLEVINRELVKDEIEIPEIDDEPHHPSTREIIDLEALIEKDETEVKELSENYSQTFNIRLNGQFVRNEAALQKISDNISDPHTPVFVLMPRQVTFSGWDEIRGLLDKIGCLNVRYFVFSKQNRTMTELELPHEAIDYTPNPPPRNTKATDSH